MVAPGSRGQLGEHVGARVHFMFTEDDLLPLSGLQHLAFCERQWALIHLEQQWAESRLTAEGRELHGRTDEPGEHWEEGVLVLRAVPIRSLRLGLSGKADVVEVRDLPNGAREFRPVEYKRGRPKPDRCDEVQLCAQALCLEEMLGVTVASADLFYAQPRRRLTVILDAALRAETERLAARMQQLFRERAAPAAVPSEKCRACSLEGLCLPGAGRRRASRYLQSAVSEALHSAE